ncbi:MAG: ligase-associated DNA damage response exonuclease [Ignavibacteriaceae bacterium]
MNYNKLLELNDKGLYCSKGGFYIDPLRAVDKALITHAHSDHARPGTKNYLAVDKSENLLKLRLGKKINLQTVKYGEILNINGIKVSFHPAGHILGSAQIRLEFDNEVVVVSGDYKTGVDFTCQQFEPVRCNIFITESTFGLPVYKWSSQKEIFDEINNWWKQNIKEGKTSILSGYSLGKAQRLISGLDPTIGSILTHSSVENINDCYRNSGINLPRTTCLEKTNDKNIFNEAIIILPPSVNNSLLIEKIKNVSRAFASGWMQVRRSRKWRSIDRGFVLSDHADWDGLINTIKETGAENIYVMHGYVSPFVRWLNENGWNAFPLENEFQREN